MRALTVILAALLAPLAHGHILPGNVVDSRDVSRLAVTVYPDDLAMVTEVRRIDVPAGQSEIRFHGVTDMIIPETAVLQSFEGLRLEGNFNSDLISKGALLQKAVGQTLTIRRLTPGTGRFELSEGELISAADMGNGIQGAVFKTDAGIEALQCSGLSEAVLFNDLPDSLNPVPVLSMTVSAKEPGPKDITLTYLTRGLNWAADYRMDVKDGEPDASLLGWLTLNNKTSKSFKNADVAVVAGSVNRAPDAGNYIAPVRAKRFSPVCGTTVTKRGGSYSSFGGSDEIIVTASRRNEIVVQEAYAEFAPAPPPPPAVMKTVSVREATRENLGDYKLYRAPQPVSLNAFQTKQIAFLLDNDVEFEASHSAAPLPGRAIRLLNMRSTTVRPAISPNPSRPARCALCPNATLGKPSLSAKTASITWPWIYRLMCASGRAF